METKERAGYMELLAVEYLKGTKQKNSMLIFFFFFFFFFFFNWFSRI